MTASPLEIDAIAELIALQEAPFDAHGEAHGIATTRLREIRSRIARLRRLERQLPRVVEACDGHPDDGPCRVLAALADHEACEGEQ